MPLGVLGSSCTSSAGPLLLLDRLGTSSFSDIFSNLFDLPGFLAGKSILDCKLAILAI